jgi:pSer/pThr/pTyr-binding forkhead associated (FHA) protein
VIICPRCSKENQDHYKFCLGCGSELPRDAVQARKDFSTQTPPGGIPQVSSEEVQQAAAEQAGPGAAPPSVEKPLELARTAVQGGSSPAPEPATAPPPAKPAPAAKPQPGQPAAATIACPSCGNPVPPSFKFCGTCGYALRAASAQQAPAAAPAQAAAPAPVAAAPKGQLILINPDGSPGEAFPLADGATPVGRNAKGPFASDLYLSPVHATFEFKGGKLFVSDENSLNGIYVKLDKNTPVPLQDGSVFRIGQEILRFEAIPEPEKLDGVERMGSPNPGFLGRICTVTGRESIGEAFAVPPDGMYMGRERGDVTFPEDGYVSGLHCRIHKEQGKVVLTDVGSSNGTFLRLREKRELPNGELLLMGQQLFCVKY